MANGVDFGSGFEPRDPFRTFHEERRRRSHKRSKAREFEERERRIGELGQRADIALNTLGGRAGDLANRADLSRDEFLGLLRGFDPRVFQGQVQSAFLSDLSDLFKEGEAGRRGALNARLPGSSVGSSRLQREIITRGGRESARQALGTAGLELGRIGEFGEVSARDLGAENSALAAFLSLLTGQQEFETESRLAEKGLRLREKQARGPNPFLRLLGAGAGAVFGPAGAALGERLGGTVSDAFGL